MSEPADGDGGVSGQLAQLRAELHALRREVASLRRHLDERLDGQLAAFHPLGELRFEHPDLRELQQTKLIVLRRFAAVCEELGAEYFLHDGTLLGAVRHQGYIPWDDDLDVAMTRPAYERLRTAMAQRDDCCFDEQVYMDGSFFGKFFLDEQDRDLDVDIFILDWCNAASIPELLAQLDRSQAALQQQLQPLFGIIKRMNIAERNKRGLRMPLHSTPQAVRLLEEPVRLIEAHLAALRGPEVLDSGSCLASLSEFVDGARFAVPAAALRPLGQLRFEDRSYPVPADCELWLRRRYGSWRQLPGDVGIIKHHPTFGVEDMERLRAFRSRHGG